MASLFTIAAALLVLALVHLSLDDPSEPQSVSVAMADDSSQAIVAHVTRDIACRWSADAPLSLEPGEYRLRKGRRLELLSGVVEIEFVSGVRSAVRGPALFSLGSDNALRLDRGDAVARVPEYAIGFVLETPSAKAVDLGTEFSANVSAGGDSDFYVEQGSVEIHPKSDETPHKPLQLSAGMGIHIPRTGRFDIATSPKQGDFLRFRALPAPSVALEGSIRLLASPATSVADESLSDDDMISMFLEREEVVAPKGLIVSTDRPGQFENLDKIDQRLDESTSVDSYFIHFRPKTPAIRATTPIIARVTFDRPVVAVLASWRQLNDSDELFGSAETEYGPVDGRGLEISANGSADVISISADRRTVSLRIYGGGSRDELRILVRSAARP
jgi:hypothetical protein